MREREREVTTSREIQLFSFPFLFWLVTWWWWWTGGVALLLLPCWRVSLGEPWGRFREKRIGDYEMGLIN